MIDHCINSLFANFEMSKGTWKLKYDSFRTIDRNNLFQVTVCQPLRPNHATLRELVAMHRTKYREPNKTN